MALLNVKKHIVNSLGEEEELNIYTTISEATNNGLYKSLKIQTLDGVLTGYIGITEDLDTLKSSSKMVMVDGKEYAERKYMGIKDMSYYMRNTYPSTYQTLTEITEDMLPEDVSDCTVFYNFFRDCSKTKNTPYIDTRNGTSFHAMYYNCSSATSFPLIDTSKGTNFQAMYGSCPSATSFPLIDTSNGTNFQKMYFYNSKATSVSNIDFSQATDDQLSGIDTENMFAACSSLRSITFNNLPIGTTEDTLRSKCAIPSTVTEIIMNFRSE